MVGVTGPPMRRRTALRLGGLALVAMAGCGNAADATIATRGLPRATTGPEAMTRLAAGNERFATGHPEHPDQGAARRTAQISSQDPFALILSCVDSRVPPELVFDQGLGDLFVVRTAGQVLGDTVTGSVEYGVEEVKTPLLVVLGHQDCGAVKATIDVVEGKAKPTGTDIDAVVAAIRPAVERAKTEQVPDLLIASTRYNTEDIVGQLRKNRVLADAVSRGALQISGGYYDIGTGRVSFFD